MPGRFTIYANTLGVPCPMRRTKLGPRKKRVVIVSSSSKIPLESYRRIRLSIRFCLCLVQIGALLDILNNRGCAVERLVETMEPIGRVV